MDKSKILGESFLSTIKEECGNLPVDKAATATIKALVAVLMGIIAASSCPKCLTEVIGRDMLRYLDEDEKNCKCKKAN